MIRFTKMHGIGNDFVIVNGLEERLDPDTLPALARAMSDRRFGVGSDGLIVLDRGPESILRMRMWNPDGSESEMCGNGVRCFARYAQDRGLAAETQIPVDTGAGRLVLEVLADLRVQVDMGIARLTASEIGMVGDPNSRMVDEPVTMPDGSKLPGTAVSMGNPHLVLFVDDVDAIPLESWGPVLEHGDRFPKRVNVHFAQVLSSRHLRQRTWERGAGITLACGTGACATGVAALVTARTEPEVEIDLPGGRLSVAYREDGRVFMTGPAEYVFEGEWR